MKNVFLRSVLDISKIGGTVQYISSIRMKQKRSHPNSRPRLLSRSEFRQQVFLRDDHRCVICGYAGQGDPDDASYTVDPHHIIERKLWTAPQELGGYFLDNGATLCETHHRAAEDTSLSCQQIREAAGITRTLLPGHLSGDLEYDKWGNVLPAHPSREHGL